MTEVLSDNSAPWVVAGDIPPYTASWAQSRCMVISTAPSSGRYNRRSLSSARALSNSQESGCKQPRSFPPSADTGGLNYTTIILTVKSDPEPDPGLHLNHIQDVPDRRLSVAHLCSQMDDHRQTLPPRNRLQFYPLPQVHAHAQRPFCRPFYRSRCKLMPQLRQERRQRWKFDENGHGQAKSDRWTGKRVYHDGREGECPALWPGERLSYSDAVFDLWCWEGRSASGKCELLHRHVNERFHKDRVR